VSGRPGHGLAGVADAGAFLARLVRLDPGAPVRLRPAAGRTALWARLPWQVLVSRTVAGPGPGADVTVAAADLLRGLAADSAELPARRDDAWRWPLPPAGAEVVETVGTDEVAALAGAAAGTLREAAAGVGGRSVGQRAIRDALLDHVALTVTLEQGNTVQVPQRLVQAVSRMGFLGPVRRPQGNDGDRSVAGSARICVAGTWTGIAAPFGVAWLQKVTTLTLMPVEPHPFG
jgi:hypothetical protein